jgi:RND family efflux transporter MFP subunit
MASEQPTVDLNRLRIQRNSPSSQQPVSRFRWKLWGPLAALLLIVVAVILSRVTGGGSVEVDLVSATLTYPSQANSVLTASGYIVAQKKASVASKGTGRLVFLGVEEGDHVMKDQIIARLEDQDAVAFLEKARADLEVARADEHDANQSLERTRKLFDAKLASQAELDAADARARRVHQSIVSNAAAVRSAEVALEYTRIRAPFTGTVLTKDADVGEVVAPFAAAANSRAAVVTMADMTSLQVEADVSESNITKVTTGQPCEIVLDAYPTIRYSGMVHKIVPTADRSKATVMTKVAFHNLDSKVLPQMSAKVTFMAVGSESSMNQPPMLTVAAGCVVDREGKKQVFRVVDNVATSTPVTVGRTFGNRMEITQGLAASDQLVLNPPEGFANGAHVKLKTH